MLVFVAGIVQAYYVSRRGAAGNPLGARAATLEWTLPSPAPFHIFQTSPHIEPSGRSAVPPFR